MVNRKATQDSQLVADGVQKHKNWIRFHCHQPGTGYSGHRITIIEQFNIRKLGEISFSVATCRWWGKNLASTAWICWTQPALCQQFRVWFTLHTHWTSYCQSSFGLNATVNLSNVANHVHTFIATIHLLYSILPAWECTTSQSISNWFHKHDNDLNVFHMAFPVTRSCDKTKNWQKERTAYKSAAVAIMSEK